jgi:hypothetical protein
MKTTAIPAQITTVEDKIAGNLNLTQLLLLLAPLFLSIFVFAVLPEKMAFNKYKIVFIVFSFIICFALCLRVKERIVLTWLGLLIFYYFRPHLYVFNKNSSYLREEKHVKKEKAEKPALTSPKQKNTAGSLSVIKLVQLENLFRLRNKKIVIKFKNKRRLALNRF